MRTQGAPGNPCALVQSSPAVSRSGASTGLGQSCCTPAHSGAASDLYGIANRITHIDRVIIRAFLHEHWGALTTGTVPAVATRLESGREWLPNGTLPSGVRTQPLPAALERKLSALPVGFERVMVDRDVLLVATATREIVDVMCNAYASDGPQSHAARERNRAVASIHFLGSARRDPAARWRLFERDSIL